MTALLLILLSAIAHAIVNVLRVTKRADDKYAMRLLIGVFSAIAVVPFLFLLPVPAQGLALACLAGTAFVHAFYELLLVKSYETSAFRRVPARAGHRATVHRYRRHAGAARASACGATFRHCAGMRRRDRHR